MTPYPGFGTTADPVRVPLPTLWLLEHTHPASQRWLHEDKTLHGFGVYPDVVWVRAEDVA